MKFKVISKFALIIGVIMLVSLACSITAPKPNIEPATAIPTDTANPEPPTPTAEPPTPVPPTTEPTVVEATVAASATSEPVTTVEFEWFSMVLPSGVADSGQSVVVEKVAPSDDAPPWAASPQHEEVKFTGYVLSGTFHEAQINVFPVEDYITLEPMIEARAATLQQIIQGRSTNPGDVPILPLWNAGQAFLAKPAYEEFQGGSGIRYLTQYGQALMPINNHDLFYSFQGLTSDGKYWISAVLPVHHPNLQDTYDNPLPPDLSAFIDTYEQYAAQTRGDLDSQPDDSFTPSLADLDAIMRSIVITR